MQKYIDRGEYISDSRYSVRPAPCIVKERLNQNYRVIAIKDKSGFDYNKEIVCAFPRHYFSFTDETNGIAMNERYCIHLGVGSWKPKRVQRNLRIWAALESVFGHRTTSLIVAGAKRLTGKGKKYA
jgi:hypothetical protein